MFTHVKSVHMVLVCSHKFCTSVKMSLRTRANMHRSQNFCLEQLRGARNSLYEKHTLSNDYFIDQYVYICVFFKHHLQTLKLGTWDQTQHHNYLHLHFNPDFYTKIKCNVPLIEISQQQGIVKG